MSKFIAGDRVELTEEGAALFRYRKAITGVVTRTPETRAQGRPLAVGTIRVLWDGAARIDTWHEDFWRPCPATPEDRP